ncbi:MAG: radical SAM protein [Acidobacteriota bacterium]
MLLLCNYYVTYKCNSSCEFCHFSDHEKFNSFPEASLTDFKSNVSQLARLGVKFIDLTGGEPLLNKDIAEMARFARSLRMQVSITTNTLLYPKFADKLAGNVNLLHFSMDSPDEEEHNSIRRVKCFKSIFKSIEIAKSLGEYPDILFTATNENFRKLPRMYEITQKHGLVLIINPVFSYFGNPGLNEEAIEYLEEFIKGKMDVYMNGAFLRLRKNGGNDVNKPSCKAVSRVIVISPDNKIVLPCYHFSNKTVPIDRPLKEIRKSEELKKYMEMEGRFPFCQGCTVNCYFEPSFAFPLDVYSIQSLGSKLKYSFNKLIVQKVKKNFQN